MTQRYVIRHIKVKKNELVKRAVRVYKVEGKEEPEVEYESLGWFVLLDGSLEHLFLGHEKPELGNWVKITVEPDVPPPGPTSAVTALPE